MGIPRRPPPMNPSRITVSVVFFILLYRDGVME
jgi:hypothetical protein